MYRKINVLLFVGIIGIFTAGSQTAVTLIRLYQEDRNIWWTHREYPLPLEEGRNVFQLYVSGKMIQDYLLQGKLLAVDSKGGQYTVVPRDVTIRLNNWCQVKSSMLATSLPSVFFLGVALTCFTIGLIQLLRARSQTQKDKTG